jgi:hypothetical protein
MRRTTLIAQADAIGRRAIKTTLGRLVALPLPEGVSAEIVGNTVILSGRNLIRRFVTDSVLRRFGR